MGHVEMGHVEMGHVYMKNVYMKNVYMGQWIMIRGTMFRWWCLHEGCSTKKILMSCKLFSRLWPKSTFNMICNYRINLKSETDQDYNYQRSDHSIHPLYKFPYWSDCTIQSFSHLNKILLLVQDQNQHGLELRRHEETYQEISKQGFF